MAVVEVPELIADTPIDEPPLVAVIEEPSASFAPIEDEPQPRASRYDRLAHWLRGQSRKTDRVQLSFAQVEQIIESQLPESARKHRAWWANDSHAHVQSISWLAADWKVSHINMDQEMVTFSRIHEREQAYISFFSRLVTELCARDQRFLPMSPNGTSWITVAKLKIHQRVIAVFNYLFTRNGLFRLELYIDTGNEAINTELYETLRVLYSPRVAELNERLGTVLEWEPLPGRRAARVAVSHVGSITAKQEDLDQVRRWAINTMVIFYDSFAEAGQLLEQQYTAGAHPALAPLFT